MDNVKISVRDLNLYYGENHALKNVNMDIKEKIKKIDAKYGQQKDLLLMDNNVLRSPKFNQIIIDLSELDFMDSTGIGVLIGRYKRMKDKHIPIFICNPSTHAERIFKMTGLYDIMPKIS